MLRHSQLAALANPTPPQQEVLCVHMVSVDQQRNSKPPGTHGSTHAIVRHSSVLTGQPRHIRKYQRHFTRPGNMD